MVNLTPEKKINFTTPQQDNSSLYTIISTKLVMVCIFIASFSTQQKAYSQYDTIQYLPPIYISNAIKTSNSNIRDHYLVLSTLEPNSFTVSLKDGTGTLFTGYTLETGTQVSPGLVNLSRSTPIRIKFSGRGVNVQNIVSRDSLNIVIKKEGLYFEAPRPFFANIRHQAGSQAGSLTTKGNSGLGTDFFVGFQNMQNSSSSVNTHESHFFSVMATEDNTSITFTNFKPGTTFYGRGINSSTSPVTATDTTITLNQGESFVQAQEKHLMPSYSTTNNYHGIRILSDKKIAVNSGSLLAVQDGNGRDIGMDQIAPTRLAGTKYGIIRGNGNSTREKVIVVSTESGATTLTTPSGTATINGIGGSVILNGGHWNNVSSPSVGTSHSNMVFTSNKPVLVYHTTFGANAGNASSLNIIPPIADCIGSDSIYVANARQFGNSSKINIISKVGSTIQIEDELGNNLLIIPSSGTSNFGGTSLNTHISTAFSIPSGIRDIFVHGDDKFSLGFFGASGVAGGAGYMSSFSLTNAEIGNTTALLNNNGVLKLDLCEVTPATVSVNNSSIYSGFQWFKDGLAITGENSSSISTSTPGSYHVTATYCSFDIATPSVNVNHFGTPGNEGLSSLSLLYQSDFFDGFSHNSNVSTWQDEGKAINNATATSSPTILNATNSAVNFNTTINFDASGNNYLKSTNALTTINNSNKMSFFIILKDNSTTNNIPVISFSNESNAPRLIKTSTGYRFLQENTGTPSIDVQTPLTNTSDYKIISCIYDGTNITMYSNGEKGAIKSHSTNLNMLTELIIGGGNEGSGLFFNGEILSLSIFGNSISDIDRQQIESYYALKYGITLNQTDDETSVEDGDYTSSSGSLIWDYSNNTSYHYMVTGIGIDACGKLNQKQSTSIEGDIVTVNLGTLTNLNSQNSTSFSNDDSFFIYGNNNEVNNSYEVNDFGTTLNGENIEGRIKRVWKSQETGTIGNISLTFDLSNMPNGSGAIGSNDLTKVRLLVDTDDTFATGATSISSTSYDQSTGMITFSHNFTSSTGFFFTLASTSINGAALPIELLTFDAQLDNKVVNLYWQTASEINNHYFVVEKSTDGNEWTEVLEQNGAGNSNNIIDYFDIDYTPFIGKSYYRLKQVDFDGNSSYSNIVPIINKNNESQGINIFPNPSNGENINLSFSGAKGEEFLVVVRDIQGKECFATIKIIESNYSITGLDISNKLSKGTYLITAASSKFLYSKKLIIK